MVVFPKVISLQSPHLAFSAPLKPSRRCPPGKKNRSASGGSGAARDGGVPDTGQTTLKCQNLVQIKAFFLGHAKRKMAHASEKA